jgi:cellulose synthase/poly-beta-1,6-N-acetylglucosamine synthase-like glycosyltransferase
VSTRPPPSQLALGLALTWTVAFGALIALADALTPHVEVGLALALFFVAQELGTTAFVLAAASRTRVALRAGERPAVSVLVAALDEAHVIERSLRSILAQRDVELEVIVADDGSRDGTADVVERAFGDRVRVLRLPHRGKGAALESARRIARHPVLVTVDADTELAPSALARLADAFVDPQVEAAAGAIVPRDPRGLLERFQVSEYLKNTLVRRGWSALGALDQVPGALAAIRARSLDRAGGFPVDSLTEDYEVAFRLYATAASEGRRIAIPTIPEARAYTETPRTIAGLVRQRTRWFAGFLSTLFRFRALVLSRRAGAFGLVRLPLKVIDATLPPIGLASLVFLVLGLASGEATFTSLSIALLAVRASTDLVVHAAAITLHRRASHTDDRSPPSIAWLAVTAVLESWSYAWLKQLAVLRAYPFALARVRTWERARDTLTEDVAPAE